MAAGENKYAARRHLFDPLSAQIVLRDWRIVVQINSPIKR